MDSPIRMTGGSEARLRRLETLRLANGLCLLALAFLLPALPFSLSVSVPLAVAFLACGANALRLRRRRAEQEARAAVLARGLLLANVSYEIRTPMEGILDTAELLLGSGLTLFQREQVVLICTSAESLLDRVDDVLERPPTGSGHPLLRPRAFLRGLAPARDERRRQTRGSRRILVVDDRSVNRSVAQALLRELGYESASADSGEQALALLAKRHFDAVLLDREMPGLDGLATCRRLRRREGSGRNTPVIAVTAHAEPEEQEACRAAGVDDQLVKPFDTADLATTLDRWTGIEGADGPEERLAQQGRIA